ncbi:MAG: TraE/TraK family type IV conjugative transfer system protein [Holosporales bacterium]
MRNSSLKRQYGKLIFDHRNQWIVIFILVSMNIVLTTAYVFKSERIVLVPSWQGKEGWVENSAVSSSYLEGWATYLASMLLEVTPQTIESRHKFILRYASTQYYNSLQKKLEEERGRLIKDGVSTSFLPIEINLNPESLKVTITGQFISYIGGRFHQATRDTYELKFEIKNFELKLVSFELRERKNAA